MALEIERRFLVKGEGWREHIQSQAQLHQGYLVSGPDGLTLRVRISRSMEEPTTRKAWLTLKAPPAGEQDPLTRLEFEYAVPIEDGEALLALATCQLSKQRYGLDLSGGDWVLDVYGGANAPLVVAEVELSHPQAPVQVPSWCVREVSGRHELSNAALAVRPLNEWSPEDRFALWEGSDP